MKKLLVFTLISAVMSSVVIPASAMNMGTYKTESEYGLFDGFKVNWKRQDKSKPFIEPREESSKSDKERDFKNYRESEYERTKYMYEGKAIL